MATLQYIGARYIPKFFEGADNAAWQPNIEYEPLTIVTYLGSSWTSKKTVPSSVGAPNLNLDYWVCTGNFNEQVENFAAAVEQVSQQYGDLANALQLFENSVEENTDKQNIINNSGGKAIVNDWVKFGKVEVPSGTYINSCFYDINADTMYIGFVKSDLTESYIKKYTGWSGKQGNYSIADNGSYTINNNHVNSLSSDGTYLYASSWNGNYVTKIPKIAFNAQEKITIGFNLRNAVVDSSRAFLFPYAQNAMLIGTGALGDGSNIFDTIYYTVPLAEQIAYAQDICFYHNCIYSLCSSGGNTAGSAPYISINSMSPETPIVVPVTLLDYKTKEHEALSVSAAGAYIITNDGYIIHSATMATVYPQIREAAYWSFPKFTTALLPLNNRRTEGLPYELLNNYYYVPIPDELIEYCWSTPILNGCLHVNIPRINNHQGSSFLVPIAGASLISAAPRYTISGNTNDGWYFADITVGYSDVAIAGKKCLRVGLNAISEINVTNNTWTKHARTDQDFNVQTLMPSISCRFVFC